MSANPLISIIMPAYNAEAYIADGIRSILAQHHRPIEVIVVDDGSTDDTASIADSFGEPVRCYRQDNTGPPSARNKGLSMAKGDYLAFLDADDVYQSNKLDLQLKLLQDNPQVDFVVGKLVREQLTSKPGEPTVFVPMEQQDDIYLQLGTILARRAAFDKVGRFDESLLPTDDLDWFKRAQELQVSRLIHDDAVVRQRLHFTNITRNRKALKHYLALMLKRSIDRQNAGDAGASRLTPSDSSRPVGNPGKKSRP